MSSSFLTLANSAEQISKNVSVPPNCDNVHGFVNEGCKVGDQREVTPWMLPVHLHRGGEEYQAIDIHSVNHDTKGLSPEIGDNHVFSSAFPEFVGQEAE